MTGKTGDYNDTDRRKEKTAGKRNGAVWKKEDICLAFSGGVDSSLLLKAASDAARENGTKVYAVTFDSRLHPSCDLEIASRVAKELGGIHEVITVDELEQEEIRHNPVNRCYLCKRHLFQGLRDFCSTEGVSGLSLTGRMKTICVYRPGNPGLKGTGDYQPAGRTAYDEGGGKGAGGRIWNLCGFPAVYTVYGNQNTL